MSFNKNSRHKLIHSKKHLFSKYYRIIEDDPPPPQPSKHPTSQNQDMHDLSKALNHHNNHRLLYIDINDSKGFKFMEECSDSQPQEQTQQLDSHFVSQLDNLSEQNVKGVSYLFQSKNTQKRKSHLLQVVSQELKKSREKLRKSGIRSYKQHLSNGKEDKMVHVYRGMDISLLEKIKLQGQYDQLSKMLKQRQDTLLKNYNTLPTHRSRNRLLTNSHTQKQPLINFLPEFSSIRASLNTMGH